MKIVIAVATRGADIYWKLAFFMAEQVRKYNAELIFGECSWSGPVAQSMCANAIYDRDFDYVLLCDADVGPPVDALDKLLAAGKDVVAAPVWMCAGQDVHVNFHRNILVREHSMPASGLEEVISTSFGCMLVTRRVFDEFKRRGEALYKPSPLIAGEVYAAADGLPLSDHVFYRKCTAMGFKIWMNWDIHGCTHFRPVPLSDELIRHIQRSIPPL